MTEPLLPDQTGDDTDSGWGDDRDRYERDRYGDDEDADERRLRDDVPPHHVDRD